MKKTLYKVLYRICSFLSEYIGNRYLTECKIMLGTSLLVLMNVGQGCKRTERVACYELSALPDDTVEIQTQQDSIEVMCYEVPANLTDEEDTITSVYASVKQPIVSEPKNENVAISVESADNEIENDIMCYSPAPGYICPDVMPEFPGGINALMSHIAKSIRYPKIAKEKDIDGRVSVQFVIMKDGSIDSVKLHQSSDSIFNEEALRVIKEMPKWKPATCKGEPVETKYTLPVRFRLLR